MASEAASTWLESANSRMICSLRLRLRVALFRSSVLPEERVAVASSALFAMVWARVSLSQQGSRILVFPHAFETQHRCSFKGNSMQHIKAHSGWLQQPKPESYTRAQITYE